MRKMALIFGGATERLSPLIPWFFLDLSRTAEIFSNATLRSTYNGSMLKSHNRVLTLSEMKPVEILLSYGCPCVEVPVLMSPECGIVPERKRVRH